MDDWRNDILIGFEREGYVRRLKGDLVVFKRLSPGGCVASHRSPAAGWPRQEVKIQDFMRLDLIIVFNNS
jgi:hypothetical protein